jgi:DNA-binding Lrp family transcriptional regulator
MDAIDRKIVALLQEDASLSLAQIAHRVGLSQSPCWKRIQRLEKAGVILRRVALISPESIGVGLTVFVSIETGDHSSAWIAKFAQLVTAMPEVHGVPPHGRRHRLHAARGRARHAGLRRLLQEADRHHAAQERDFALLDGAHQVDDGLSHRRRREGGKA